MEVGAVSKSLIIVMFLLMGAGALTSPSLADDEASSFSERVRAAMASDARPAEDKARDANRLPIETLAFAGLHERMDVLELIPGGGWYTRILAPALAGKGSLSVWVGIDRFAARMQQPGLEDVRIVAEDVVLVPTDRRGIFDLPGSAAKSLGKNDFDAVLTFRNAHNLTPAARAVLSQAVFRTLRPGGIYLVVDHTRRHMEPDSPENRRRLDPVVAVQEALAAGFEFVAFSDLHYRADDELRFEVGRRSVTGNSDRFTLLFRKPR